MSEPFGRWLKSKREDRGLTLRDIERITEGKVSNATISQIETGKIKSPSLHACIWIAAALGLDGTQVFERATAPDAALPTPDFCPHCGQLMDPRKVVF